MMGASAADLASTEYALRKPGLAEANPLMQGPAFRYAVKAATTAAVLASYRELNRRGKKKAAKALALFAIAAWSAAAAHNLHMALSSGD